MFKFIRKEEDGVVTYSLAGNLHERYKEAMQQFNSAYTLQNVIVNISEIIPGKASRTKRTCRYCSLSYPVVKFKKDAHLISEMLGNRNILSDFECDDCNTLFSKYENDLAYFLGFTRTVLQTKGKKSVPKFKSPDESIVVKQDVIPEIDDKPKVVFQFIKRRKETIKIDKLNKKLTIQTTKHSYIPLNIYKILLKMAIGALPKEELENYEEANKFITNRINIQSKGNAMFKAFYYFIPGFSFPSPLLLLFKKNNPTDPYPTHTACLYCYNSIFQIALPNLKNDKWMYDGKQKVEFIRLPPLIDKHLIQHFGIPQSTVLDLSNEEKVKGEKLSITFSFDTSRRLFPTFKTARIIKTHQDKIRNKIVNQLLNSNV